MTRRRGGLRPLELVVVVLVVAILVRLGLPAYHRVTVHDQAVSLLDRIETVRAAALSHHADHGEWPPDVHPGVVPPGLGPYLGDDFSFRDRAYLLDWGHWTLPDGAPGHPEADVLVAISVVTDNATLAQTVLSLAGADAVHYTLPERYTFIIAAR